MRYFVYILECADGSFYKGFTTNLETRINKHRQGYYPGSYTEKRRPVVLKWYAEFNSYTGGKSFERQIKGWRREKLLALINEEYEKLPELSKSYHSKKTNIIVWE